MFGIKFIKFDSTAYVIHFKKGKIIKEGRGLSFYYYAPTSSITVVPLGSNDFQFIFKETTSDFQTITIQGQITYQISEPKQLADSLDYTVDYKGRYKTDDHEKLSQRLINESQTATSSYIQSLTLKKALVSAKQIEEKILSGLNDSKSVAILGVKPMSVNVVAVKPNPEMARALETSTREALQQEADAAIYLRRNFAVEQERKIKESELNTEIAVEEKKKSISEKKMEAEILQEQNQRKLKEMRLSNDIMIEENKWKVREIKMEADIAMQLKQSELLEIQTKNEKLIADSKNYALKASITPYKDIDWKTIMAIRPEAISAKDNIAIAFREMAQNADKIGTLNISPDLLEQIASE